MQKEKDMTRKEEHDRKGDKVKGKEWIWVGGSVVRICHPQHFTTSTSLQDLHWKPNQQQTELDTQPSGHEEKSNHIRNH